MVLLGNDPPWRRIWQFAILQISLKGSLEALNSTLGLDL